MPAVLRYKGYVFFFFSNEGTPREPAHVHVRHGSATAKFWLLPEARVADSDGIALHELRELTRVVRAIRERLLRSWEEFFHE